MYQGNNFGGDRPRSSRPGFKKKRFGGSSEGASHNSYRKFKSGIDFKTGAQVTKPERSDRPYGERSSGPKRFGSRPNSSGFKSFSRGPRRDSFQRGGESSSYSNTPRPERSFDGESRSFTPRSSSPRSFSRPRFGSASGPRRDSFSPRPRRDYSSTPAVSGEQQVRNDSPRNFTPRDSSEHFNRPRFNGPSRNGGFRGNSGSRFGGRGGRKGFKTKSMDVSRLINTPVVTEAPKDYVAKNKFADFVIDERIKNNVIAKGYVTPTAIQDQAIPEVLNGIDVVGLANTGTGKTAAFLIPLIDKIVKNNNEKVLVVVPTRELAIQIEEELRAFTKSLPIWGVVCVGGANIVAQIKGLQRQHNFVIGTPGRLKDLIERKTLKLENFKTVVLDEADRMLDMGFVGDIKYMMSLMSEDRQTLFFSATITPEIEGLIHKFLKNPVKVSVRTGDTSKSVAQDIVRVPEGKTKIDVLAELLAKSGFEKVLIFGRTKHGVERLTKDLNKLGIKAESIHGNKTHGKRQKALSLFKDHHVQALVATDVAARGLDISGITHVINYDLPATYEDYVHRIGRTGRGGKTGIALSFVE